MTTHLHIIDGCAPIPLVNYLKALGILRLVAEQADTQARGWWERERFCFLSRLSKEELEAFFLQAYEPTPLIAPWNGGSGFFAKDNRKAISSIKNANAVRLARYQAAIRQAELVLCGLTVKPDKKQKLEIQRQATLQWRGRHQAWLQAAFVLDDRGAPSYPSLLGTGGNDGRLDFTNNFMQQLCQLIDMNQESGNPTERSRDLLRDSLWSKPSNQLQSLSIGQFQPGSAGGANSSTGFASGNLVNAWDFVLMMEGAVLFASRVTRRLDPNAFGKASAPFAVRPHSAGYSTQGSEDAQRGEQWMPLWRQPATLLEFATMLAEARIHLGRQVANRPIDMARAVNRLGVARGVEAFVRYGYLERNGQSKLAVPLGRVLVRHHPRAYLIDDMSVWLDQLQRRSRDKNSPSRLVHAERRLANAVFSALTHDPSSERLQAIFLSVAEIESMQAKGTGIDAGLLNGLRPEWVEAVNDGTPEFRLALALGSTASSYFNHIPRDPIRHHFLPLKPGATRFNTSDNRLVDDPRVVVSGRDPVRDLARIVERRIIEAKQNGTRRLPMVAAPGCGARFDDLARFLEGSLDINRLFGLARAFMAIRWDRWSREHYPTIKSSADIPDECWLTLRLCILPFALDEKHDIPADERIIRLLLSGDVGRAIAIARLRLRSVGIRPPLYTGMMPPDNARQWAAALAFPIHRSSALRAAIILDPSMKGTLHG